MSNVRPAVNVRCIRCDRDLLHRTRLQNTRSVRHCIRRASDLQHRSSKEQGQCSASSSTRACFEIRSGALRRRAPTSRRPGKCTALSPAARPEGGPRADACVCSAECECEVIVRANAGRALAPGAKCCLAGYRSSTLSAMKGRGTPNTSVRLNASPNAAFLSHRSNPSIEGTCNIWLRQLLPAPHVKR